MCGYGIRQYILVPFWLTWFKFNNLSTIYLHEWNYLEGYYIKFNISQRVVLKIVNKKLHELGFASNNRVMWWIQVINIRTKQKGISRHSNLAQQTTTKHINSKTKTFKTHSHHEKCPHQITTWQFERVAPSFHRFSHHQLLTKQ